MNANVSGEVVKLISGVLGVAPSEITEDTAIGDIESWDSLHHLQIIAKIEQAYGFKFTPDVMMDLEDVGDIVKATGDRVS